MHLSVPWPSGARQSAFLFILLFIYFLQDPALVRQLGVTGMHFFIIAAGFLFSVLGKCGRI